MDIENPQVLLGMEVLFRDGSRLGTVEDIYLDQSTGRPEWAEVRTGVFGDKRSLVPLAVAEQDGRAIRVPFDQAWISGAPHHEPGTQLSPQDEAAFFAYYGLPYGSAQGYDDSGPVTEVTTQPEGELRVGRTPIETGRFRLRKYVVTEPVQAMVPVRRERVRIEREPITDIEIGAALNSIQLTEAVHEVVLYEEQPIVEKAVVPKERVRLATNESVDAIPTEADSLNERIDTEGTTGLGFSGPYPSEAE